jgi:hypothetical protein
MKGRKMDLGSFLNANNLSLSAEIVDMACKTIAGSAAIAALFPKPVLRFLPFLDKVVQLLALNVRNAKNQK